MTHPERFFGPPVKNVKSGVNRVTTERRDSELDHWSLVFRSHHSRASYITVSARRSTRRVPYLARPRPASRFISDVLSYRQAILWAKNTRRFQRWISRKRCNSFWNSRHDSMPARRSLL